LKPLTREDAAAAFRRGLSQQLEWTIEHNSRWIGVARLTLSEAEKLGRFATGISSINKLGKWLGTEATQLVLGYAFNVLRLHRVDLRVLENNKRAIRCHEKVWLCLAQIQPPELA
jgi:[ribosomal protein S5]-alanine N-acetyltransferase